MRMQINRRKFVLFIGASRVMFETCDEQLPCLLRRFITVDLNQIFSANRLFSKAEAVDRKLKAKLACLSISNYNRNKLGSPILKQGKPKKTIAETAVQVKDENYFSFEPDDELPEILPTVIEVENAFEEIFQLDEPEVLKTETETPKSENAVIGMNQSIQPCLFSH
jgi:hypothetical protein